MKSISWETEKYPSWIFSAEACCVSVIVPLHQLPSKKMADPLQVQKAITKAKANMALKHSAELCRKLGGALDDLYDQIDFTEYAEGIGLFVSENVKEKVWFYLPVKEEIVLSGSFSVRDWLYQRPVSQSYFVLHLDEKGARLFKGTFNHLQEIQDAKFPRMFKDDYEYNRPSRASSYVGEATVKQFEKDKPQLKHLHYEGFLQQMDADLKNYVSDMPLMVTGVSKHLAEYKKISGQFILTELKGNFYQDIQLLGQKALDAWKQWLGQFQNERLVELMENIGKRRAVTGLDESWKTVQEKNALRLLVEKDFSQPGFLLDSNSYNLFQLHPNEPHIVLPDAVNDLILAALNQNTEVIMMENGSLQKFGRIGVITRY